MQPAPRFALIGAAGFVAPRHLQAIKDVGGDLVAVLDPHDAVGILDRFNFTTEFFTAPERFERHLEKLRYDGKGIDWLVVCSPNHLHDTHARLGLQLGANVLCEKPIVLNPWNLDILEETEAATAKRVYTVLQLRHAKKLQDLHYALSKETGRVDVKLRYVTPRGPWYQQSWKGDVARSGGIITNIGIHMLDLLLWLFGDAEVLAVHKGATRARGSLRFERATVEWLLSVDPADSIDGSAERYIEIDGYRTEFTGFEGLHTTVYQETLAGRGHGISDARPAVELAAQLR